MKKFILITALLLFFPGLVIAQEVRLCDVPYQCYSVGKNKVAKIFKFTSRAAFETWLNAGDRSNCDEPFYSTASNVEVVCYEGTYVKECQDKIGICGG